MKIGQHVALVGTCPSSRMLAPYRDQSVEIWACGPDNVMQLPRVTRWFEIHGDLGQPGGEPWERSYIDWLNAQSAAKAFDLIVSDQRTFPLGHLLPHKELVGRFGPLFFTSSPAWMLAFAILNGVKKVGLYGLDMSAKREYLIERPGMHHFMDLAEREFGVEIYAPMESDILQPAPLYGFDKNTPRGRKMEVRRIELMSRIGEIDGEVEKLRSERRFLEGAVDNLDYMQTIWNGERDPALDVPERELKQAAKVVAIGSKE